MTSGGGVGTARGGAGRRAVGKGLHDTGGASAACNTAVHGVGTPEEEGGGDVAEGMTPFPEEGRWLSTAGTIDAVALWTPSRSGGDAVPPVASALGQ